MSSFTKLLIANRGEIAVRVIRACRDLGITTVAVFADADREAKHVRLADEAYALGGGSLADTYLSINKILDIARRSGAGAVHPGYGFLSENAEFARAVAGAGLAFVGPTADVIAKMGSKVVSRQTMQAAGVPVVPGTLEPTQNAAEVRAFAQIHGFPIALKASAGGGGKGLRVVRDEAAIDTELAAAIREGQSYFGDGTVYMEKYLPAPRHVEVQLLADQHGQVLHLFERDCSLQRRHQKVFEEAPAPRLSPQVRDALLAAAVRGAKAIGYRGAGTFEFLVQDDEFYFLEANTRLQVEHGITELITGVDIVQWMIRIASGEALPFAQDAIVPRGHAIECRINAEAVDRNFAPAPGVLTAYAEPAGPWVRVDSAAFEGWDIPSQYDSMIAKLMVWAPSRDEALARTERALREYKVEGVPTTIPLHEWILRQDAIRSGQYDTGYLTREFDPKQLPASLPAIQAERGERNRRQIQVEVNDRLFAVTVIQPADAAGGAGRPHGREKNAKKGLAAGGVLPAPLSGTVVAVKVAVGDPAAAGQTVLIIEAMKMENDIAVPQAGTVKAVHVKAGDPVTAGSPLVTIE